MAILQHATDAVHWFMDELGARVVTQTGISSDRHHLGKLILQSLKDAPDFVMQIDGATGQSENYQSVLERSVKCATSLKKYGFKPGDVIVLIAPCHIDLAIPLYAALYLGMPVAALDANLQVLELESMFKVNQAKLIFCQSDKVSIIKEALKNIKLESTIITFDDSDCINFNRFMEKYGQKTDVENFKATDFDPKEQIAMLISTSGTTGLSKFVALTHANIVFSSTYVWASFSKFPTPTRMALASSSLHWLSPALFFLLSPVMRYTRLQTSVTLTQDHFKELVKTYKPSFTIVTPTLMTTLLKPGNRETLDITCFDAITIAGTQMPREVLDEVNKISPKTDIRERYGLSEVGGVAFFDCHKKLGSVGRPIGLFDYRLVDPKTKEDITIPHVNGELWLRGPSVCKGYYNNPKATKEAFEEDWLKTGDIFYRDEHYYFYFVDRLKLMLKYKSYKVSPVEVETVIRQHPGVLDVAVIGIPDPEVGDLVVACVVPRPGHTPRAQEIKDLVKSNFTDSKQLRGGVIFMSEFPMTASTKVHRRKLKEMVLTMPRE